MTYQQYLDGLRQAGNFRTIPPQQGGGIIDFSSNDYLGLASRHDLQRRFMDDPANRNVPLTSSASRLLAARQDEYAELEQMLASLYHRPTLLFNSGYHVNSGLIPALCDPGTVIVADRLVHASIIDGIMLSHAPFDRFRHNDLRHLEKLLQKHAQAPRVLVVAESVYSMDGDTADIQALAQLKRRYPNVVLYIDEAHALGVEGTHGLGLAATNEDVDVVIGTFGKALASVGAFAALRGELRDVAVNRARSLIFSTSLPPLNVRWTRFMMAQMLEMDAERQHLKELGAELTLRIAGKSEPRHIVPLIVGDPVKAVAKSQQILTRGLKVLPIRTPTVPPGTDRLRISLSAAMDMGQIDLLARTIAEVAGI